MEHTHGLRDIVCDLSTKKACEDRYSDWQAMQQVLLAYRVALRGDAPRYRKESSVFAQLVGYIAGDRESLDNKDGTASAAPFTKRILAAIDRVIVGGAAGYNLYTPSGEKEA
jgi:hypothetical protein